ncbi:MAG: hypothetical protein NWF06_01640 [Candidatus Bathyarchaeota archaeon]|nr:hypothetical protein [Candidatus Bathyarchaeum sp.]
MLEALFSTLQSFFLHPEFLVPTVWVAFGCVLAWFLLSAKRHHAIDKKDLKMLWKTHKQFNNCSAKTFEPIMRGKTIVGYTCECGYQHLQERPLVNFGA